VIGTGTVTFNPLISHQMTLPSVLVVTNSVPFLDFNQTKSEIDSE
jgi:hypothetical protein